MSVCLPVWVCVCLSIQSGDSAKERQSKLLKVISSSLYLAEERTLSEEQDGERRDEVS